jgi:hypothetical protein
MALAVVMRLKSGDGAVPRAPGEPHMALKLSPPVLTHISVAPR